MSSKAEDVVRRHYKELLALPDVHGIDIEYRRRGGSEPVDPATVPPAELEEVIVLHYEDVLSSEDRGPRAPYPTELEGVRIVAVESERPRLAAQNPMAGGLQIQRVCWDQSNLGTSTTCVHKRTAHGQDITKTYLMSAAHVLDPTIMGRKPVDDAVYQPESILGRNRIGVKSEQRFGAFNGYGIDVGLALLDSGVGGGNYVWNIGYITGVARAEQFMKVMKKGRSTGVTHGIIQSLRYTTQQYGATLFNMLLIDVDPSRGGDTRDRFCDEGDSGAPILDEHRQLVGIIHARKGSQCIATQAHPAFEELNVRLYATD